MKLRTKIIIFSSMFMFCLVLLMNVSIYIYFYNVSKNLELDELDQVATNIISALNENPEVDPAGLMKGYLPVNGMIRVVSANGVPIIEQTRAKDYLTLPWSFTNQESKTILSQKGEADIALIEKPIIWQTGERKGEIMTLQVSNHLLALSDTMRRLLNVLSILTILILIPVVFASAALSRFLLKPIQKLIQVMRQNMNKGEWQKLDVTKRSRDELYEMEMTFNEMIEHLKTAYEKQDMFVSDASHELKTPIQIIKSYAQLLKRRGQVDPELYKEAVQAIDSETDRINNLIEQMLLLAKNEHVQQIEKVDIIMLIKETVAAFQGVMEREIRFMSSEEKLFAQGNIGQLKQIFYILVDNALKYSKESIDIHAFRAQDQIFIQVKDYGQGISKEDQDKIFDRFYRVDKARSRATGGTGLGLSIAKGIAKAHGGDLTVDSELNKGTTFTLTLVNRIS